MNGDGGEGGNSGSLGEDTSSEVSSTETGIISNSEVETSASLTETESETVFGEKVSETDIAFNKEETVVSDNILSEEEIESAFNENTEQTEVSLRDPTLSEEQLAIIEDMEEKGEMEINADQLGETIVGGSNERLGEIQIDMPYNGDAKYDVSTFIEQAQAQEDGLNTLTVQEYLDNYSSRIENGRSEEGTKVQNQYTDGLKESLVDEKMQEGKSLEQAQKEASEELAGKSALHNPDQIAGGKATVISSKGDTAVNSALGSLWGHRRGNELHAQISEMSKDMTTEEKATTYLNVRINTHSN